MKDETIIRMAADASKALSTVDGHIHCGYLVPSYNAMLTAARTNHPNDPFLSVLSNIELGDRPNKEYSICGAEMRVLLGQLRIALESLQENEGPSNEEPAKAGKAER